MTKHYKVGITGGIGAGKTTVSKIFRALGVPVYYSDDRAKALMHLELKDQIVDLLGKDSYDEKGSLNRPYIASKVFNDKDLLSQLNQIVHPAVRKDYKCFSECQTAEYSLNEAALLVENDSYKNLDALIVVSAPENARIERVMKRDDASIEQVKARIANQISDEERNDKATYIINNDDQNSLIEQVLKVHQFILNQVNS